MKKTILLLGIFTVFAFTSINAEENKIEEVYRSCGEGQTEVSWSVDCPDGNKSGSICVASEHAVEATEQIMSAEC